MAAPIIAYVVQYQVSPRGTWYEYFKWFGNKADAQSWISWNELIQKGRVKYRIKPKRKVGLRREADK